MASSVPATAATALMPEPAAVQSGTAVAAATAEKAAKKVTSEPNWKVIVAVVLASAAVGAGAWYLLSGNGKKPSRPSTAGPRRKTKGSRASKSSPTAKAEEAKTSDTTPAVTGSTTADGYPAALFPEDINVLSQAAREDLALQAKTLGNKFYGEKKFKEAIDLYSQAIALKPTAVFYANRAACYASLDDHDKVIEDATEALKLDSQYVKALNRRAQAYERLEKFAESLNDYTVVCVLGEFKNDSVLAATDRVLKSMAQQKAKVLMETRVAKLPSDTFTSAYMDSFHMTTKGVDAILKIEPVEEGDKEVLKAYEAVGKRDWSTAHEAVLAAFSNGNLSTTFVPLAHNLRATFHFLLGDVDSAFTDLEKVLEVEPHNIDAMIKRASIFMERGDVMQAMNEYNRAIELDPSDPDVYYHRGQIRVLTQDMQGAIDDYKKSISLDEDFVYPRIQLGVAQYKMGDVGAANATFEKATRRFKESGEVFNYQGEILMDSQRFDEALELFNKASSLMPQSPLPYINKAILYLQWKQDAIAAEEQCRKALEVDPLCDMAYAQLAQLLMHQGKVEESIEAYDKASELARTEPELVNAIALREAATAQLHVAQNYPAVMARLRTAMQG
ncbi:TOM (translocase of outer membrane) complex component [Gaertneriomyces sp. JEL0708]|nr:TOM (translocase of outer membrane) complex component [Gaertneriomyces sp. JEL0708]